MFPKTHVFRFITICYDFFFFVTWQSQEPSVSRKQISRNTLWLFFYIYFYIFKKYLYILFCPLFSLSALSFRRICLKAKRTRNLICFKRRAEKKQRPGARGRQTTQLQNVFGFGAISGMWAMLPNFTGEPILVANPPASNTQAYSAQPSIDAMPCRVAHTHTDPSW